MQSKTPNISIAAFVEKSPPELQIEVLAGNAGLDDRFINSARIQKLGLALAGFAHYIHKGRIQIVGQSEIWYLSQLESEKRTEAIQNLDLDKVSCILITKGLDPVPELTRLAEDKGLPLLRTNMISSGAINQVSVFLQEILAPQITLHGVLMGMFGIGVLILGDSGIGKSECALDLITRGHYLIADDSVTIKKVGDKLEGKSPELIQDYLEIHGLGIINIRELFGVSAIGKGSQIEICIELKNWKEFEEIDRLGLKMHEEEIFGLKIPKFVLPVSSGRNLSTLVETAVRIHLLREAGFDAARSLIEKHQLLVGGL
ncbi:MAG: HPr(Ser) kinase/phosphatase [Acidobacteria bacterium]|nr:HPr(Ser) kinase/phosphatase [Acidobacteriota bacterium]